MAFAHRIRVFLIHTDPVAHAGLSTALSRYADLEILNADFDAGIGSGRSDADVVVADYAHGIEPGYHRPRRAVSDNGPKVLIVANTVREWEIRCALARGVLGYVLAGSSVNELAAGIRAVHRGMRHLGPQVAQILADCLSGDPLTARETEVLRLVVEGMPNKAIARRLDIAIGTVKSHLKRVFDKLNVDSRTQAICAAERRGLLCETPRMSRTVDAAAARSAEHHAGF